MNSRTYYIHGRIPSVNRTPHGNIGLRRQYQVEKLDPFYESVAVQMAAVDNLEGREKMTGEFFVTSFMFYFPDNRRRDEDNHVKALKDGVFKYLGVDDTKNMGSVVWKKQKKDGATEHGARIEIISVDDWREPISLHDLVKEPIVTNILGVL